ncbi:hypothetical protein [Pararhizobium sp.]|uniref:hypothetical protein n=1 Tax=Pararhizobium sp. TaxID=1977563 RepID=UPI00272651AD|nr:hypothetical protein [Pararhizobium sp.]MDO9416210.1 hypothetical protein [Pararhizobium sp.]
MTSIAQIRQQYPQYEDMSDQALASALHQKFYSDMPGPEFLEAIGMSQQPEAQQGDGLALNTTAGLNNAIYSTLGAPVDLARGAINLGIRGVNAAAGSELPTISSDSFGGSESISSMFGAVGVPEPKDIRAESTEERIARGVGEGVGYAVAPEAAMGGLLRAGAVSGRVADAGARLFGRGDRVGSAAANMLAGGAGGAGSTAAMEAAPEEYRTLAGMTGGLLGGLGGATVASVPSMGRAAGRAVGEFVAPMTKSGREGLAAAQLRENATDPQAVKEMLDDMPEDLVGGSRPTTFQLTGDMGLGGLERGAQTRRPEAFNQRRADQNSARVKGLTGIQPEGAPEKVAESARRVMQAFEQRADEAFETATAQARQRTEAVGRGASPEVVGDNMRLSLEEARKAAKDTERQLWNAVDPDGSLALPAANVRQQVENTLADLPKSAKPPSGEEAAIYEASRQLTDVVPFSEVTAMQSRVKTELRVERLANGESAAYRRLAQLKSALDADIESAVAGKIEVEAQAVARGEMSEDETIAAFLRGSVDDWLNARQARTGTSDGGASAFPTGRGRVAAVSGEGGAGREATGKSFGSSSDTGLSAGSLEPNFDAGAAERLRAAQSATRARAETFDNKIIGPMRKRPSSVSPYDMAAASLPMRIFSSRGDSGEAISKLRAAVGDKAANRQIEDFAVDRLRKSALRDDGTLDPVKLESWRRSHRDALKALPNLDRRLVDATAAGNVMAEVGKRQKAVLDEARRSRLGKLMHLSDPADVTRAIGAVFQLHDRNNQMARLASIASRDPEAKQGLRKAVVDHVMTRFVGNTEAGTSGQAAIKADQFQTFMKENVQTLRLAGFSADEVKLMTSIAQDIQRANRSNTSVKLPGGSNTAQDWKKVKDGDAPTTVLGRILLAAGAGGGFASGGIPGGLVGAFGAKAAGVMREYGIETVNDLVADALLHPGRARLLLSRANPKHGPAVSAMLAKTYRHSISSLTAQHLSREDGNSEKRRPLELTVEVPFQ